MTYIIAQICGIGATVCSLAPLLKKKWQMLLVSMIANGLVAVNLILLGQTGSAVFMNFAAIVQISVSLWHVLNNKPVRRAENIIFMIILIGLGIAGFNRKLDIMPLFGSVFFVLSVFVRDEQKTRIYAICNAVIYLIYFIILGSTSAFAQLSAITMNSIGLYIYRKGK